MAGGQRWTPAGIGRHKKQQEGEPSAPPAPPRPKGPTAIDFSTAEKKYASIASWLLPYLSPENTSTMNAWMQRNVPGLVKPTPVGPIPTEVTTQIRNQYLSADRATRASEALRRMQQAAGEKGKALGPGFTFIRQAIGLLQQFGGGTNRGPGMANGAMSRSEYTQFSNAVSSLIKDASNERGMGEYVQLATMFLRPNFSAGQLMPGTQTQDGRYLYGQANTRFFT